MTREQIEAAAASHIFPNGKRLNEVESKPTIFKGGFYSGALWMQEQMQAQKEQWQREAWEAARKTSQEAEGFVYYKFEDWKGQK